MATLITHDDLDGVTCAILFKAAFAEGQYYLVNYNKVYRTIKNLSFDLTVDIPIFVTDLSLQEEDAICILDDAAHFRMLRLFDHHKENRLKKYSWATVDASECSAALFHNYLIKNGYHGLSKYIDLVGLVNDYDLCIHDDPHSRRLNSYFRAVGPDRFIKRFLENASVELTPRENWLLDIALEQDLRYIHQACDKSKPIIIADKCLFVAFAERLHSEIGKYILEHWPHVVIAVVVDMVHETVSLYSRLGTDVSVIAKELCGGGRPQAANYPLDANAYRYKTACTIIAARGGNILAQHDGNE